LSLFLSDQSLARLITRYSRPRIPARADQPAGLNRTASRSAIGQQETLDRSRCLLASGLSPHAAISAPV